MKKMIMAAILTVVIVSGCRNAPDLEICYTHPVYGTVCVKIGGKQHKIDRTDLTDAQKKEVEEWLKNQPR
jgi:hypothetical protein